MSCLISSPHNFFGLPLPLLKPSIANLSHLYRVNISFSHALTITVSLSASCPPPKPFPSYLEYLISNLVSPTMPIQPSQHTHFHIFHLQNVRVLECPTLLFYPASLISTAAPNELLIPLFIGSIKEVIRRWSQRRVGYK